MDGWIHFTILQWRHNDHCGVSNHQPHDCLLNRLFRRRSKKTSKLRITGFCAGNSPGPVNSPHKGPVTRKMFPFDDVIMTDAITYLCPNRNYSKRNVPDSKVRGTNMGPIWGRQGPGGPHVGPMNFAIWGVLPECPPPWACLILKDWR